MKKKENNNSLTARQRKEQRMREQGIPTAEDEAQKAAAEERKAKQKRNLSIALKITAIVLVAVIGIGAIGLGVAFGVGAFDNVFNKDKGNPIATFYLSNGKTINFELYYDKAPAYAANFIYLAESNFFDNTLFSNVNNRYAVMGGFVEHGEKNTNRAQDESYVSTLKGFNSARSNVWNHNVSGEEFKLGYRLNYGAKPSSGKYSGKPYYMVMFAGTSTYGTATHFGFTAQGNTGFLPISSNSSVIYMGYVADNDSMAVIDEVCASVSKENPLVNEWRYTDEVKINDVKISNISKALRSKIINDFEEFVVNPESTMEGALTAGSYTWRGTSYIY